MRRPSVPVALMLSSVAVASCYRLPVWDGDVEVAARERAAIKTCGTGALTTEGKATIQRWPYLQSTTTTSTTIVWGAKDAAAAKRGAEVVLRSPDGAEVARVAAVPAGEPALLQATFASLTPTSLYCYQLVAGDTPLTDPAPLTTAAAPATADPTRFVVFGDSGNGSTAQKAVARRMNAEPFDFIVQLGDLAYERGTTQQFEDYFFSIYRDVIRYVPVYPTIGNHERHTKFGEPYFNAFVLPAPERYYAFEWGDIHFICIDTTVTDSLQLVWLAAELQRKKSAWTIVFGHHPMYSNSLRGPSPRLRRAYSNLLRKFGVDISLAGHEHHYERFQVAGVNYVVSGGGGGRLTRLFGSSRAIEQATVHHFLAFEVTATSLYMRMIDIDGRVLDELRLTKK